MSCECLVLSCEYPVLSIVLSVLGEYFWFIFILKRFFRLLDK